MNTPRPVKELPSETARKIAAGEVIDRPAAIVRELMDNAIDAGAEFVCVEIEDGGIGKIRVTDDGFGMSKEDLYCCAKPHATSKITTAEDLLELNTLGFRGEALGSIAAVSRLSITTIREGSVGYKLEARSLNEHIVTPVHWSKGTAVESAALFENFPARRVFLKKPAAEAKQCKQTFIEKAMPWTESAFRFIQDGKQKIDLPAHQPLAERFAAALEMPEPVSMFHEVSSGVLETDGFHFSLVLGDCAAPRNDKKSIYIFVNGRRIWEYALVQAIEYGAQGYFPNGTYPAAALFLTVNPKLVDFNIHPAKREARFKDISVIHHAVSSTVRNFYRSSSIARLVLDASAENEDGTEAEIAQLPHEAPLYDIQTGRELESFAAAEKIAPYSQPHTAHFAQNRFSSPYTAEPHCTAECAYSSIEHVQQPTSTKSMLDSGIADVQTRDSVYSTNTSDAAAYQASKTTAPNTVQTASAQNLHGNESFRYYGTALGVFLLAEKNGALYLIDQHAAHERILYNRFMEAAGSQQKLLFPYTIETETESDDAYLTSLIPEMEKTGFQLHNAGNGTWEVTAVPIQWVGTEEDLERDLLRSRIRPEELSSKIAASCACRAAVKDGTILDPSAAEKLVQQAFALPDPHCPHGRPVWTVITKQELFHIVRRTE